jgi:DNA-binding transcriptional LysR family regulator
MTYEQLRVLQAVVTEGTFRGAAQKLYKSQPAVSNLIRKLEQECAIKLFSRGQYRPALTPEGWIFYEKARLALKQMNELTGLAKRMAKHEEAVVRIAINAICPLTILLDTLKAVDEAYPVTELNVSTASMGGAMEQLRDGMANMVITTQTDMDPTNMEAIPFMTVRLLQVAHRDYEPARHGRMNAAEDMRHYVQLIVEDSSRHSRKQTLDVLEVAKHWRVTDFAASKDIILSGMAWGGMPEHLIEVELARGELVPIHVAGIEPRLSQLYLIRRTDKSIGIVARALWKALQDLSKN